MFLFNNNPMWHLFLKSNKKSTDYKNNTVFQLVFNQLLSTALSRFEWNLPDTMDATVLEYSLIMQGFACAVNDADYGLINLRCSVENIHYNLYGHPNKVRGFGVNGFNKDYLAYIPGGITKPDMAVICYDSDTKFPLVNSLWFYAEQIANCIRTIENAQMKLKTPYFIVCSQEQEKGLRKIISDIENNEPIIATNTTLDERFEVAPTNVTTETLTTMWELKANWKNEIDTILGLQSPQNMDKKERLLVDEVNSQEVISDIHLDGCLKSRLKFCERFNLITGQNISVRINPLFVTQEELSEDETDRADESEVAKDGI